MQSQTIDPRRHLALEGSYNIRDLGGYETPDGPTQWRRFLRADGLHRLRPEGLDALKSEGLSLVIDLRRPEELAQFANPFATDPSITYRNISLFEALAPEAMARELPPEDDLLLTLYRIALAERRAVFAEVLGTIAEAPEGLILFHCTAGKDRTGLIAALLLELAGVARETVIHDYGLTTDYLAPALPRLLDYAVRHGQSRETLTRLLESRPETMRAALATLDEDHGGARAYLAGAGLSEAQLAALIRRIRAPSTAEAAL